MKTLLVMRHAKSSWDNTDMSDFARPLNKRGFDTAPVMGEYILRSRLQPDAIVSSPAERAAQTAQIIHQTARIESEIIFDKRIYEAGISDLLDVIGEQSDGNDSILLIGHNPGLENLIRNLTGDIEPMLTAALAVINLEIERWNDIGGAKGELKSLIRPKELAK